ncbi:MAG: undecaprenyl-diphosphate phosphatase [Pikeienuella sp.]
MPLFHLIILSIIQGVTEFLPISSSGHLVLYPQLTGAPDQGLAIDVAVHVGTLGAVLLYFRRDVALAVVGGLKLLTGDFKSPGARLALLLILSAIPVMIVGVVLKLTGATDQLRSVAVIGWATIVWGVVLYVADKTGAEIKTGEQWTLRDALAMGVAQCFALIPGTSRSGVTMTAARSMGYTRVEAARLSMLMSIPAIVAAGGLLSLELLGDESTTLGADALMAAGFSFIAALLALVGMMRMLQTWSMTPFVIYRMALGVGLLIFAYG